jgi:hypothetical protein
MQDEIRARCGVMCPSVGVVWLPACRPRRPSARRCARDIATAATRREIDLQQVLGHRMICSPAGSEQAPSATDRRRRRAHLSRL